MALQLMKLAITADTTISVEPNADKFFYVTTAQTDAGNDLTIDAADFFNDDGSATTELPTLETDNHYYQVSINGVLQMQDNATYTPGATGVGSLVISVPAGGDPILANSPVILEIINYTPNAATTVET